MNEHLPTNPVSELAGLPVLGVTGLPVLAPGFEGDERRPEAIIEIPGAGCVIGTPDPEAWMALCALVAEVEL